MRGVITHINPRNGMFIVQISGGDFAAFSLQDSLELAVGDVISGNLDALGGEELLHLGQGEVFNAVGESGPSSLQVCRRLIAT